MTWLTHSVHNLILDKVYYAAPMRTVNSYSALIWKLSLKNLENCWFIVATDCQLCQQKIPHKQQFYRNFQNTFRFNISEELAINSQFTTSSKAVEYHVGFYSQSLPFAPCLLSTLLHRVVSCWAIQYLGKKH